MSILEPTGGIVPVTIANGASLSDVVTIDPRTVVVGIEMPGAWTAAQLTFQVSTDGVTFKNLFNNAGSELTTTGAAVNLVLHLDWTQFVGIRYLRVRSGTSGTPVNQLADRVLNLILA